MTPVVALARYPLTAKAHAKVPLSNTTVSGLPLKFRKFKSVQSWLGYILCDPFGDAAVTVPDHAKIPP